MTDTQQWVAMGYIKGVFGVKGWLKVAAGTEYADSLLDYPEWRLSKDGRHRSVTLEAGKVAGGILQVKLEGIDDRDEAFALRGCTIEIPRAAFAPAEEGEYYWADLVGMTVTGTEGAALGTVTDLMETGAHDILVVDGGYGRKLIPFVSRYILAVDAAARTITADWGADY